MQTQKKRKRGTKDLARLLASHICFPSSINSSVGRERVRTGGEVLLRRGEAALIIWAALQ